MELFRMNELRHEFSNKAELCKFTTPGMVDLQVNGYAGIDFNNPNITGKDIDLALSKMLKRGTCFCLPTIITAPIERLRNNLVALDKAINESKLGAKMILGIHLEGPFISKKDGYRGCHPIEGVCKPEIETYKKLVYGLKTKISMVTLAPEEDINFELTRYLMEHNVIVSIGHSAADLDTINSISNIGVNCATHLNNGLTPLVDKNSNPLFSILSNDKIMAGIITDGVHILPHILKIIWRTKTSKRLFLVTDGTAASDAPVGQYSLGLIDIRRDIDDKVKMIDEDRLAGSCATMESMVNNLYKSTQLSLNEIADITSNNPLNLLKLLRSDIEISNTVFWIEKNGEIQVEKTLFNDEYYYNDYISKDS